MIFLKKLIVKISAAALALLLVLGAVSCAKEEGPAANYETFKAAMEKTSALEDWNLSVEANANVSASGEQQDINMAITAQAKDLEENPQMNFSLDLELAGEKQSIGFYFADGVAYMDQDGVKQKAEVSMDDIKSMLGTQTDDLQVTIPEESELEGAQYTKENGNVIVTMTMTAEEIQEMIASLSAMPELEDSSIESVMEMMEWKDITVKITINQESYITQLDVSAGMSISAEGETGSFDLSLTVKLIDPGKDFTVTAPSDLDAYEAA